MNKKKNSFNILSLDLATKTGWAMDGVSGVEDFAVRRGESPGMRYIRFTAWLKEIINKADIGLVVYEQCHLRGGHATEVLLGFTTHLQSVCAGKGVEFATCHTGTLKKFATGKGSGGKDKMIAAYKLKWGKPPIDDNECDARWLLEWAKKEFC